MPELPEVQTTVQGLQILSNMKINNIKIYSTKLRYKIPKNLSKQLKNIKIKKIYRIGKYIIINLGNQYSLIFHLGMSGRLRVLKSCKFTKRKHDHFMLVTTKNALIYNDVRKFGFIDLLKTKEVLNKDYIFKLGIDALDKKLSVMYFYKKIQKSDVLIKQILLNQHIVCGIGNIYASEILFDAKISPFRKGKDLNKSQISTILNSVRKILKKGIKYGGSSINDYVSPDGTLGNFQNNFKVYGKAGFHVKGFEIKKTVLYGRSTFFCPEIQK